MPSKCSWAEKSPLLQDYHDNEWGIPVYDSQKLFEMLMLEIMSCGLSWEIVLKKREHLRAAFSHFDPALITSYTETKIDELMHNPNIIRSRAKIVSVIQNAHAYIELSKTISFSDFFWQYFNHKPLINYSSDTNTPITHSICNQLRQNNFKFIGPTVVYSFLQASGIINDHDATCPCRNHNCNYPIAN